MNPSAQALAILALVSGTGFGQTATRPLPIRIMGRVSDVTHLPLRYTLVTLTTSESDQSTSEVVTDEEGYFVFGDVPSKSYILRFEERGFRPATGRLELQPAARDVDIGTVVLEIGDVQEGPVLPAGGRPLPEFADFPALPNKRRAAAASAIKRGIDQPYRQIIQSALGKGATFAGHYQLVRFRLGSGPLGAIVVDAISGGVFLLPSRVTHEDFFVHNADCIDRSKRWYPRRAQEQNTASDWSFRLDDEVDLARVLSYRRDSELLMVRRCTGSGVLTDYFRWHGERWHLLRSVTVPPPPPLPVP